MVLSALELLTAAPDISAFDCGKPTLDHWLKTRALSNQEKVLTAILVVHEAGRVVGYSFFISIGWDLNLPGRRLALAWPHYFDGFSLALIEPVGSDSRDPIG